ncbi:hypothetical protein ACFVAD_10710 [Sutcliffiella sp. NPDC057660]|uniref:hypothetical protein n=1 Tax=Sutcliffiella sp. NPDC057660 TaxID=3346199 RepID=UPI003688D933
MFLLLYISGGIFLISIIVFVVSAIAFRRETKPTFESIQRIEMRLQEEKEAINIQTEKMKIKKDELKNDLDWKKSVFTFTISELKRLLDTLFKTSANQKTDHYPREI